MSWLRRASEVVRRVDQGYVRERLRKVSDEPSRVHVVLLGQQADVVAKVEQPPEQPARILHSAGQHVRVRQPETAREKDAFSRWQSIAALRRVVAQKEPVAQQSA